MFLVTFENDEGNIRGVWVKAKTYRDARQIVSENRHRWNVRYLTYDQECLIDKEILNTKLNPFIAPSV